MVERWKVGNYERSLEKVKEKNGGILPSDLYLKTCAELNAILYAMTKQPKYLPYGRSESKEALVKRIQRLRGEGDPPKQTKKRKEREEEMKENMPPPPAKLATTAKDKEVPVVVDLVVDLAVETKVPDVREERAEPLTFKQIMENMKNRKRGDRSNSSYQATYC